MDAQWRYITATIVKAEIPGDLLDPSYPCRYQALEPILDRCRRVRSPGDSTALGPALTLLAEQPNPGDNMAITNAGPAAYAVLLRAGRGAGCPGQLDLLLVPRRGPPDAALRAHASRG